MTRYGWSLGRDASSPYASMSSLPEVGDDDFSYITSQDIDDRYSAGARHHARARTSNNPADLEDDILHIKNKGVTYPAHFPAYSIGDGKLYVSDVRDRIALMMDLPSRSAKRIKLLYKGKQLKESTMPIRDYGVKNKSEIMAVIPDVDDDSSLSGEEAASVGEASMNDPRSKSRRKKRGKRKPERSDTNSPTSPRENGQPFDQPMSPRGSSASVAAANAAVPAPMKKLSGIAEEFETKWLPLCREYIEAPPADAKKRDEDYRRLSESLMQHILLKLDGVETEGIVAVRTRRKELVGRVQGVLKELDVAKSS